MAEQSPLVSSLNIFTVNFYKSLIENSAGNIFFSPFSIITALGMVHMGSEGNTWNQFKAVMNISDDKNSLAESFNNALYGLKGSEEYQLHIANMMYVSKKHEILEEFNTFLTEKFLSTSESVDFSDTVRQKINKDVEKETNSKIKELLPSGSIGWDTVMVLVNAIYFKGIWKHQFNSTLTKTRKFWLDTTSSVDVSMMNIKKEFGITHSKELESKILRMDYQGDGISMYILLPDKIDGLQALEEKLSPSVLESIEKNMHDREVNLFLPKFKLEEPIELIPFLKKMGINDLFSDQNANLSGISNTEGLYVSTAVHKAFLEVNEEGVEAAAATAVVMRCRSMPIHHSLEVNHPFLFLIKTNYSGMVLFLGRYSNPRPKENVLKEEL